MRGRLGPDTLGFEVTRGPSSMIVRAPFKSGSPSFVAESLIDLRGALAELELAQRELDFVLRLPAGRSRNQLESEVLRRVALARRFLKAILSRHEP